MEEEVENPTKSATVQCVQYIISQHMKSLHVIKKDDLMKTVFKGRVNGKNYERVIGDVASTLKNVFGFSLSFTKDDHKQFIIVNTIDKIDIPGLSDSSEHSKYRNLLKPIIGALIMLRTPISEGQMWNIMEQFSNRFNLDMDIIKDMVKKDFVRDQYLQYKATDDTTVMLDPDRTSHWFSMGPRGLIECDKTVLLQRMGELYNVPPNLFKLVFASINNAQV